jgi:hypothetical protein
VWWHSALAEIAHHPAANGLVERFHRTLKAAIMVHADWQWTEALPLILLGIRTSFKEDLQASVAELVYGEPLRIAGELLNPSATQRAQRLSSSSSANTWPASDQFRQPATPPLLHSCTRTSRSAHTSSAIRTQCTGTWSPHTAAPTRSWPRRDKTLQLLVCGRGPSWVSSLIIYLWIFRMWPHFYHISG